MNRIKRIWILGLLLIGASCNSLDAPRAACRLERVRHHQQRLPSPGWMWLRRIRLWKKTCLKKERGF